MAPLSLFVIDVLRPFKRILFFSAPVFFPLVAVIFGMEREAEVRKVFENEDFFEQLKTALEEKER
ncbi:MAG: hypothetical protein ACOX2F_07475 [bacterium]